MNFVRDHLSALIRTNFSADQMRRFALLALASMALLASECVDAQPSGTTMLVLKGVSGA